MPTRKQWMFDPDSGGKKIPENVKRDVEKRIHAVASEQYQGKYKRLEIRFRGQFCYIDAYTEPQIPENWPPAKLAGKQRRIYRKDAQHSRPSMPFALLWQ